MRRRVRVPGGETPPSSERYIVSSSCVSNNKKTCTCAGACTLTCTYACTCACTSTCTCACTCPSKFAGACTGTSECTWVRTCNVGLTTCPSPFFVTFGGGWDLSGRALRRKVMQSSLAKLRNFGLCPSSSLCRHFGPGPYATGRSLAPLRHQFCGEFALLCSRTLLQAA